MNSITALLATHTAESNQATNSFRLHGRLIGHSDCYQFLDAVRDQITTTTPNVSLDAEHISLINSAGIGILASLIVACRQAGGHLTIAGGGKRFVRSVRATFPENFLKMVDKPSATSPAQEVAYEHRLFCEDQAKDGMLRFECVC